MVDYGAYKQMKPYFTYIAIKASFDVSVGANLCYHWNVDNYPGETYNTKQLHENQDEHDIAVTFHSLSS